MKQIIFPSIMAKNQKELEEDFKKLRGAVEELHLDVVDGKFAPNHSLNFNLQLSGKFFYTAHLMIKDPEEWIKKYLKQKKIKMFIPQFEEVRNKKKYISWMKEQNQKIAFALKPETRVEEIASYLPDTSCVLILTVKPGFYGSPYLPKNLKKIQQIKSINSRIEVIVDGGMNPETIGEAAKAGADYFVSGSYTTKAEKPKESIRKLKEVIESE